MEKLLEMEFFENAVLIDGLCNHMKPAINRMKQGVFTENQYIDMLEEKYSKIYKATIKACDFLKEELHIEKLPEGEMGFIALYFCVAVEQQKDKEEKLSVYVACPHGVGNIPYASRSSEKRISAADGTKDHLDSRDQRRGADRRRN